MYSCKTILKHSHYFIMIHPGSSAVKKKVRQQKPPHPSLLLAEGLTVGALVLGGVRLMGTHQDPVQGAVVLVIAVISTLLNGALDALVGMTVH